ncbi:MAG: hypothetical protein K0V04_23485 [Deltaproteobacteria bacterium]|nr:hypothetical protein [Deltaproteobacteria bacterium]
MRSHNSNAALHWAGAAAFILMSLLLPRVSWAAPQDAVEWGLHEVTLDNATVVVHSRWSLSGPVDGDVDLAAPLPAATEVVGATIEHAADGSVSALNLSTDGNGLYSIETRVPWDHVRRTGVLPVPVPVGRSIHRVVLSPSLSFTPDPSLGLIAQVGHYAPADIDVVTRHRFDARTDGDLRHVGAYYMRGEDLRRRALRGEVELKRHKMGRAAIVAGGLFGLVVLGMIVIRRRLDRSVRHERAEAFLRDEFDALDDEDPPPSPTATTHPTPPLPYAAAPPSPQ